jgi:hypothetical protein
MLIIGHHMVPVLVPVLPISHNINIFREFLILLNQLFLYIPNVIMVITFHSYLFQLDFLFNTSRFIFVKAYVSKGHLGYARFHMITILTVVGSSAALYGSILPPGHTQIWVNWFASLFCCYAFVPQRVKVKYQSYKSFISAQMNMDRNVTKMAVNNFVKHKGDHFTSGESAQWTNTAGWTRLEYAYGWVSISRY